MNQFPVPVASRAAIQSQAAMQMSRKMIELQAALAEKRFTARVYSVHQDIMIYVPEPEVDAVARFLKRGNFGGFEILEKRPQ